MLFKSKVGIDASIWISDAIAKMFLSSANKRGFLIMGLYTSSFGISSFL